MITMQSNERQIHLSYGRIALENALSDDDGCVKTCPKPIGKYWYNPRVSFPRPHQHGPSLYGDKEDLEGMPLKANI